LKLLIALLIVLNLAQASVLKTNTHIREVGVLNSLDIDESFLMDKTLITMKDEYENYYKKESFFKRFSNGSIFIPILKDKMREANVPLVFLYLAMAESDFSLSSRSNQKATGIWQIMPQTAKNFGLRVDLYTDERQDPLKSTDAAIKYLKYLHSIFGKWYLVALAYNSGEGTISKAIEDAGSDSLDVLMDTSNNYIPKESRVFLRKIIALADMGGDVPNMVDNEMEHVLNSGANNSIAPIKIRGGTPLSSLTQNTGLSLQELKRLNRHLKYDFTPPNVKDYTLYIPYEKLAMFKDNYKPSKVFDRVIVHNVKKGESLHIISKKYNIPVQVIKDMNRLKSNQLVVNSELIIPLSNNS